MSWDTVDILLMAAGSGTRMGVSERKQWVQVCGLPLFLYTAERFRMFGFDSICIVAHPDEMQRVHEEVARLEHNNCYHIVAGGMDRQESVRLGLQATTRSIVAIHDAARPFVALRDVEEVIETTLVQGAATLAYPAKDSLLQVVGNCVVNSVPREGIWQAQTPQVARRQWLLDAHKLAFEQKWTVTDDASLLQQAGYSVRVVQGSSWNVKLTVPEDLRLLDWISES